MAALLAVSVLTGHRAGAQDGTRVSATLGSHTRHVLLVMTDGFRWQEVFRGAEERLITRDNGVRHPDKLRREFWRDSPDARRQALLPFLWGTMQRDGQLFGNRDAGSVATVANGFRFSYPGYSETLAGYADPHVNSNRHGPNENTTVLEWLNRQAGFRGRVAAFASWGAFTRIFNAARSGVPVVDGWQPGGAPPSPLRRGGLRALLSSLVRYGKNDGRDAVTFGKALDYLETRKPRVLFVGFGETDDQAHSGHYDQYLHAAHQMDAYLRSLWTAVQSDPALKDSTTLIVTTDHGRGTGMHDWRDHGADVDGSGDIWMAVMGPDTPALGMRTHSEPVQQAQVAATIAAFLGRNFQQASPEAAPPIPDVFAAPFSPATPP